MGNKCSRRRPSETDAERGTLQSEKTPDSPPSQKPQRASGAVGGLQLRFEVGQKVQCRTGRGDSDEAWSLGTIVKLWYREPGWPPGRTAPYQVKLDNGPLIFAPMDDDFVVREPTGLLNDGKIPTTVLTGFLGAGKTTLLNYILKVNHGKKYAIIENEVGAIGVDNHLLKLGKQETQESVTLLDNGCLCCTVRGDLIQAIRNIVEAAKKKEKQAQPGEKVLDGIIIETTGLADPGPICKTFYGDPFTSTYCRIDGVITLVDAVNFVAQLSRRRSDGAVNESAQQIAFADKVLMNKIDAVSAEKLQEAMEAVRSVNPHVAIAQCSIAKSPDAVPLGELLSVGGFDLEKLLDGGADIDLSVCGTVTMHVPAAGHGHSQGHGQGHGHGGGHGGSPGDGGGHGDHGHGHNDHGHGHGHGHGQVNGTFRHDSGVGSFVCELVDEPVDMLAFSEWVNDLLQNSENLYRYKGILACRDQPGAPVYLRVIQGVHDMMQSEEGGNWRHGERIKSQLVLIGKDLDHPRWQESFQRLGQRPR